MDRRDFLKRSAAFAVGAGIASGIASGAAEMVTPRGANAQASSEQEIQVVEGRVLEVRRLEEGPNLPKETVVDLDTDTGKEPVRFFDSNHRNYPGPNFDLDLLDRILDVGDRARIAVYERKEISGYDGLMILEVR